MIMELKYHLKRNTFLKLPKKNTVLICVGGGSAGRKIGFTEKEVCFGNKLFAFYPKEDIVSKFIYYYYYFSSIFQNDFRKQLTGII